MRGTSVLLVERGKPPFAGRLSLPGGRVEFGETLIEAVRREIFEETGLSVPEPRFLRVHEAIDRAAGLHAVIAVFVGQLEAGAAPVAAGDASSLGFHPFADLAGLASQGRLTDGLEAVVSDAAARLGANAWLP